MMAKVRSSGRLVVWPSNVHAHNAGTMAGVSDHMDIYRGASATTGRPDDRTTGQAARPRAAFTLIELLAVIGIIGILAGMVFGGVMVAKRSALKTKTQSLIQQVQAACDSYRTATGVYPEGWKVTTTTSVTWEWGNVFESSPGVYKRPIDAAGVQTIPDAEWKLVTDRLRQQLEGIGTQLPATGLQDAWKKPLRYRPARFYPFDSTATIKIDSDKPPGNDSYQIWSIGPDGLDGAGEDTLTGRDDILSWTR
jgi:prepilin-type N-terminal cleavage/methylation domain-containing protein